jgi:tetratricopeptide (TPR) repeat protein
MDAIWQRAALGRHSAVLGQAVGEPPGTLRVLRVSCDVPATTLGPLLEARRKVEQILDREAPLLDQARGRVVAGLRRHLLGDLPALATDGSLVEAWNRLSEHRGPRYVLLFDAVDGADDATLDVLRQILARPGWLRLPLLLVFRSVRPTGAPAALLQALRAGEGPEAVRGAPVEEAPLPSALPALVPTPFELRALPTEVLRVLRAGAVAGTGFEAELVAQVLAVDPLFVLEQLQRGSDAGLPLEDRGEGRFHLPEPLIEALRATTLPSLAVALHRRFAELLDGDPVTRRSHARALASTQLEEPLEPAPAPVVEAREAAPISAVELSDRPPAVEPSEPPPVVEPSEPPPVVEPSKPPPVVEPSKPPPVVEPSKPPPAVEPPDIAPPPLVDPAVAEAAIAEALAASQLSLHPPPAHLPPAVEPEAAAPVDPPADRPSVTEIFPEGPAVVDPKEDEGAGAEPPGGKAPPFAANDSPTNVVPIWFKPFGGERRGRSEAVESSFREPVTVAPRDERARPLRADARDERARPLRADARDERRQRLPETPQQSDAARAAGHLAAAGEPEAGAERYFAAARQAAAAGAYPQAAAHDRKALALLDGLPVSPRRRRLRVAILLDLGRLRWHAAGPDASFALSGALEVLEQARASLQADDPPELVAEVAALIAGVCHDIGDLHSLERALDELSTASRRLLSAGDALGAARLLNDQAAVYMRLGDPVRATHLLGESRKVFEERAAADPVAMVEMAETDHLVATIPLHVQARPGRESDALSMGLDHALAAERVYRKLGAPRELARVWETMGRIELRKGRSERAMERLSAAMQVQESIGDLIGLARSTAGLSEVLLAAGRRRDALALLAESVSFNLEKGSPIGLAFNRRAFDALIAAAPDRREIAAVAEQVASRLAAAESVLGRISLPGERDAPAR